jgi:hypothetical protein
MTVFWFIFALSIGAMLGFGLFAALTVSRDEQRSAARAMPPRGLHPLEGDTWS